MQYRFPIIFLALLSLWFCSCSSKFVAPEPSVEDLLSEAKGLMNKGNYGLAKEKFEAIRFDYPGNSLIGEVQFYIGLCYFDLKEYLIAQQEFESFLREFPSSNPFSDDAMYYLSRTIFEQALPVRLDQAITRKALEQADAFLETYPQSDFTEEVRKLKTRCIDRLAEKEFLDGRLYRRMGYPSSAILYFRMLVKDFPGNHWILRGRYEWSRALYEQKNYTEALSMIDTCRKELAQLSQKEQDNFILKEAHGFPYKLVHLFGLINYESRSEIKIYIDDLYSDLSTLSVKIEKKLKKLSARKK